MVDGDAPLGGTIFRSEVTFRIFEKDRQTDFVLKGILKVPN